MADAPKKGKGGSAPKQPQQNNPPKDAAPKEKQQAPSKQSEKAPVKQTAPTKAKETKPEAAPVKESKKEETQPTPAPTTENTTTVATPVAADAQGGKKQARPQREYVRGRGTVKAVLSGDLIVVVHLEPNRPPQEKEIALSNVQAPKLGRRGKEKTADEEFAFASREFLRKNVIGKPVSYTIESKGKVGSNREYGVVVVTTKEGKEIDLAQLVIGEGYARVRRREAKEGDKVSTGPLRADVEELMKLEEAAKAEGKGLHTKNESARKASIRPSVEVNYSEAYEKLKKAPQQAVVERCLTGSTLILTLLPSLQEVRLLLSGVECPPQTQDQEFEPFGREAKFCTEHFLLNRDVTVILEGADRYNLFGTVDYMGNNISEELLKRGLAKYVDWSGSRTAFSEKLKAAQKQAQDKKICIWSTSGPAAQTKAQAAAGKIAKEINGKVVRVITSGLIEVVDGQGVSHEVTLSSIQVPRGGSMRPKEKKQDDKAEKNLIVGEVAKPKTVSEKDQKDHEEALERTWAWEGKEFLRKRLIGQRVRAVLDYVQPAQQNQVPHKGKDGNPRVEKDRNCYSVYLDKNNIAVELTAAGLATPRGHRGGEQRSKDYEDILKAENLAIKGNRGRHSSKAAVLYINDISQDPELAKKFLPSIKRGRQRGVVLKVFNAAKFKVWVPKESCELNLALSAIKAPRLGEPFSEESIKYIEEKIQQRDIEFEVTGVDRGGNFVATVWANKENISTVVLREGFGQFLRGVGRELENYTELEDAETHAKKAHKNLWKDWDEAAENAKREERRAANALTKGEKDSDQFVDVIITEILDANRFYIQIVGAEAAKLDDLMANLSTDDAPTEGFVPKVKDLVRAQYTADDQWYRASIVAAGEKEGEFQVLYVDYGNSETIPASRIKPLSEKFGLNTLPAQAKESHLAFIKPPAINDDYGTDAAEFVRDLVEGKTMMASIEYKDSTNGSLYLSLGDRESQVHVNAALVRAGLARVKRPRGELMTKPRGAVDQLIAKLKEEEDKARTSRTCVWEYGDPGSDDEEDRDRPKPKGADDKKKVADKKGGDVKK